VNPQALLSILLEAAHVVGGKILKIVSIDIVTLDDQRGNADRLKISVEILDVPLISDLFRETVMRTLRDDPRELI
jgi:hypothetical protein